MASIHGGSPQSSQGPLEPLQPLVPPDVSDGTYTAGANLEGSIEKLATELIKAQGGLTSGDINLLKAMAAPLLSGPLLPAPDQKALSSWLDKLALYEKTPMSTLGKLRQDVLHGKPPENNPYLEPGVMALLAPILSELSIIMAEIMRQSSLLQQAMMSLTVAMAEEVFHEAIAAGDAKVKQLQMEIAQSIVACVTAAVQLGCTFALGGMNEVKISEAKAPVRQAEGKVADLKAREQGGDAVRARMEERQAEAAKLDRGPKGTFESDRAFQTRQANNKAHDDGTADLAAKGDTKPTPDEMRKAEADVAAAKQQYSSDMGNISTRFQIINQAIAQGGTMITSGSQAVTTALKIAPVLEEAMANAMKDMLSQLLQLVSTTMSSAQQSGQGADKEWEAINQLFRDFGSTITRAMYQG